MRTGCARAGQVLFLVSALLLAACGGERDAAVAPDLSNLESIRIHFEHAGWGSTEEDFMVTPVGRERFVIKGRYVADRGRPVDVEKPVAPGVVTSFLRQLESPAWSRDRGLEAVMHAVDVQALRSVEPMQRLPPSPCTDDELRMLARRQTGRTALYALLGEHYGTGFGWTDDYPRILVQVTRRGRETVLLRSDSQKAFMLPWTQGEPTDFLSAGGETWSLPLSTSLQAMLPAASRAHARLGGQDSLNQRLQSLVQYKAERLCDDARSPGRRVPTT